MNRSLRTAGHSIFRSAIVTAAACCISPIPAVAQGEASFQPVGPWVSELGASASNQGDTLLVRSGSVRTNTIYSDFVLRFEFRLLERQSEGHLLVRAWLGYGNSPRNERGYRIALTDNADGEEALGRVTRAADVKMQEVTFDLDGAKRPAGAWQECEVRANRDTIIVRVNGAAVSTVQGLDEFAGYIALQSSRGSGIEFRNLRAESLPPAQEPFGRNAYRTSESGVELPRAVARAQPFYPREPHGQGIQGTVKLEVVIERTGSVGDVRVIKSLHPDLDQAAIASARKWRFTPGTKDGQSVDVIVTMDVEFLLRK
jgi:TonB family protein